MSARIQLKPQFNSSEEPVSIFWEHSMGSILIPPVFDRLLMLTLEYIFQNYKLVSFVMLVSCLELHQACSFVGQRRP